MPGFHIYPHHHCNRPSPGATREAAMGYVGWSLLATGPNEISEDTGHLSTHVTARAIQARLGKGTGMAWMKSRR